MRSFPSSWTSLNSVNFQFWFVCKFLITTVTLELFKWWKTNITSVACERLFSIMHLCNVAFKLWFCAKQKRLLLFMNSCNMSFQFHIFVKKKHHKYCIWKASFHYPISFFHHELMECDVSNSELLLNRHSKCCSWKTLVHHELIQYVISNVVVTFLSEFFGHLFIKPLLQSLQLIGFFPLKCLSQALQLKGFFHLFEIKYFCLHWFKKFLLHLNGLTPSWTNLLYVFL